MLQAYRYRDLLSVLFFILFFKGISVLSPVTLETVNDSLLSFRVARGMVKGELPSCALLGMKQGFQHY